MASENSATTQVIRVGPGLTTIGIITGIVLCILQGVGVINIGWFWATFPFWIVPAACFGIIILSWIILLIVAGIAALVGRGKKR